MRVGADGPVCFLCFQQAGLSGSSAIVCAALSCLIDFYGVRDKISVEVRPNLILNAEKELGIVAGLQDRVAQVYGGLVYMVMCGSYTTIFTFTCCLVLLNLSIAFCFSGF